MQRDQGRVRVNVQLIDAQSGAHIWADRFEEDVADLFKLQDEVVDRLANSLGNELVKAEARGDRRIANLDAFDLTMRGRALHFEFLRRPTREDNNAVRALFEQALAINPEDAGALAGDARTYLFDKVSRLGKRRCRLRRQGSRAGRPLDRDRPQRSRSLFCKKHLPFVRAASCGRGAASRRCRARFESRLRAPVPCTRHAKNQLGMFAEGRSDVLRAIQLSPRDPGLGLWYAALAASDIGLGHFDDAITDGNRAIDAGYRTFVVYSNLAAACAMANRIDDARAAVAEALKLNPKYQRQIDVRTLS